jgi:uncharacterized phage protein (TIGR01671 family)
MREIKFRAWDKKSKKMRVVSNIVFDSYSEFSKNIKVKLVNLWGKIFPAYDDGECNNDILVQREGNTFVLMQYTGLKDKNGVEIYEGDILKTPCMDDFKDSVGIVEYDNGLFCIRANKSKVKRPMNTTLSKDLILPFVEADTYHGFEIIGNIYENPELLEQQ